MGRTRIVVAALLAFPLVRCSSDTSQPKYPDTGSYCRARAEAECSDAVVASCAVASKGTCAAQRQLLCQAGLPAGKVYGSSKTEICIKAVADAYTDAQLTKEEIQAYTTACAVVFSGAGAKGEACVQNLDCNQSAGLACVLHASNAPGVDAGPTPSAVAGTCQVPQSVQGGESCAAADAQCVEQFHCGLTQHCDANGANGDPCSAALPCKSAFKCSANSTCEPRLDNGQACTTDGECVSGICLQGSNLCVAKVTLSPSEPFCTATGGRD